MIETILKTTAVGFLFGMALTIATLGTFGLIDYLFSLITEWPEEDND